MMFETECAELETMANDHTVENCATGWLDRRPVKDAKVLTVTQTFKVLKKEVPDLEVVPYVLANDIRRYQRETVNPKIDVYRLSTLASAAAVRVVETAHINTLIAEINKQTNEIHKQYGSKIPLVVMLNSRLYIRLLNSKYFGFREEGFIAQGGVNVVCKKIGSNLVLPVRERLLKSEYLKTNDDVCFTSQARTYNWIICPYGIMTGETTTKLKYAASTQDDNAWVFNYTKTMKLFDPQKPIENVVVSVADQRK